ncbi:MAG TPA: exo-beta-N-acetylmuramidase NamZ domain-containing protein [Thermoanaerobaculia bacterium]|nr:exo-beta-N-acetylmuramidase NamZ domain-containing protein [Thermoanaerobaculia bacterium]
MKRLLALLLLTACASLQSPKPAVDAAIEQAIAEKRIPGGVLWIEHEGSVYQRAYGNRALVPAVEAMTDDTIFDAASITKVVATAPTVWLLIERGKIALDEPVRTYLPEYSDERVTVRHLLTHTSGLHPGLDLHGDWRGYDAAIRRALAERPRNTPGAIFRYSDVNYILLGELVRRVSGERLDVFAHRNIFEPLGMRDTGFGPVKSPRVAPTEETGGGMLRGVVHDPTARRMDGIAGHAGLFTTAKDLARFARAVLRSVPSPPPGGGEGQGEGEAPRAGAPHPNPLPARGERGLSNALRSMTRIASPPNVAVRRMGGFDVDSAYSRPRGEHFPLGKSFGHTGWTGGFLWIDPTSRTFYIFLSNRVHPDGRGSVIALQKRLGTLIAESLRNVPLCGGQTILSVRTGRIACPPQRVGSVLGGADAQNGIDVLYALDYKPLRGYRIGLIANRSSIDRAGNPTIDLLRSAPGVTLVSLFTPEHGINATADEKVPDAPGIYSLYGERRKPTREQLAGLDALVFDIQDIGTRFYTYISTMGLAMEAAADAKIPFIVLDRVNPIGGEVFEGPLLEGETNFTGWHSLPVRHGMTVGELAKMFRAERKIDVELRVIEVRGWKREQWQDEAGLPWIDTSPNMRSLAAAALYPGLGLLERALSVGRGTDTPFEILGAPYIDGERLAQELRDVPGVAFTPVRFTPTASVHRGEECGGMRIAITDRKALRSVSMGVAIAAALARLYPSRFPVDELQPLLRHRETLEAIRAGKTIEWNLDDFARRRTQYLLYR